jgi:HAD superfamily hydrolase (TIGR01490 family)
MHRIAIYDMDKTLTRRPTWTRFLIHAARAQAPWRLALLPLAGLLGLGYATGALDRARLKGATGRLMLGARLAPRQAARLAEGFAAREAAGGMFAAARARVEADRAEGYRVVIATASYRFYAAAIGAALGIGEIIATEADMEADGTILPRVAGENCYGAAKLAMVEAWLAGQGIARTDAHVRAYSDSVTDAPLLAWADEAFAANPHPPLRHLAAERGWAILDWGD